MHVSAKRPPAPRDRHLTREIVCQGCVLAGYPAISPRRRFPAPGALGAEDVVHDSDESDV